MKSRELVVGVLYFGLVGCSPRDAKVSTPEERLCFKNPKLCASDEGKDTKQNSDARTGEKSPRVDDFALAAHLVERLFEISNMSLALQDADHETLMGYSRSKSATEGLLWERHSTLVGKNSRQAAKLVESKAIETPDPLVKEIWNLKRLNMETDPLLKASLQAEEFRWLQILEGSTKSEPSQRLDVWETGKTLEISWTTETQGEFHYKIPLKLRWQKDKEIVVSDWQITVHGFLKKLEKLSVEKLVIEAQNESQSKILQIVATSPLEIQTECPDLAGSLELKRWDSQGVRSYPMELKSNFVGVHLNAKNEQQGFKQSVDSCEQRPLVNYSRLFHY